jgi:hypothetical protein
MPAFDAPAVLTALRDIVQNDVGVETVYLGVPSSIGAIAACYVAMAGQAYGDARVNKIVERELRVWVVFLYQVGEGVDPEPAELQQAAWVDLFVKAMYAQRNAASVLSNMALDMDIADSPDYSNFSEIEYRGYPIMVRVRQQHGW